MADMISANRTSVARLVFIPSVIALAVTLLRLIGELWHWSTTWFDPEAGGITPSNVSWIIGITWLALPFGVYFAWKLKSADQGPVNIGKSVAIAVCGVAIFAAGMYLIVPSLNVGMKPRLLIIWACSVIPAAIQFFGWPQLWKALLAYGLASRIPVVVIMFFAMRGNWKTHYDYGGQIPPEALGEYYFWLALIPQLIFWVSFTIIFGALSGSITAAITGGKRANRNEGAYGVAG